jgi:hypothetical protein
MWTYSSAYINFLEGPPWPSGTTTLRAADEGFSSSLGYFFSGL